MKIQTCFNELFLIYFLVFHFLVLYKFFFLSLNTVQIFKQTKKIIFFVTNLKKKISTFFNDMEPVLEHSLTVNPNDLIH